MENNGELLFWTICFLIAIAGTIYKIYRWSIGRPIKDYSSYESRVWDDDIQTDPTYRHSTRTSLWRD